MPKVVGSRPLSAPRCGRSVHRAARRRRHRPGACSPMIVDRSQPCATSAMLTLLAGDEPQIDGDRRYRSAYADPAIRPVPLSSTAAAIRRRARSAAASMRCAPGLPPAPTTSPVLPPTHDIDMISQDIEHARVGDRYSQLVCLPFEAIDAATIAPVSPPVRRASTISSSTTSQFAAMRAIFDRISLSYSGDNVLRIG